MVSVIQFPFSLTMTLHIRMPWKRIPQEFAWRSAILSGKVSVIWRLCGVRWDEKLLPTILLLLVLPVSPSQPCVGFLTPMAASDTKLPWQCILPLTLYAASDTLWAAIDTVVFFWHCMLPVASDTVCCLWRCMLPVMLYVACDTVCCLWRCSLLLTLNAACDAVCCLWHCRLPLDTDGCPWTAKILILESQPNSSFPPVHLCLRVLFLKKKKEFYSYFS